MQTGDVDVRRMGSGRGQLGGLEVVLAILVAQLELRAAQLLQQLLVPVQRLLLLPVVRAVLARAFVDGAVGTLLPGEEGVAAVGAPVRSFRRAMTASDLRDTATDFAAQLAGFPAIVGVEEVAGCAAVGTTTGGRQGVSAGTLNRRQRSAVLALVLSQQLPPVQGAGGRRGWLGQGGQRIDVEIAVVRMLLAKIIARLRLGLTAGEDLLQLLDEFLQILAGKFSAEPKHQSWYVAHGGESLGNLAGSLLGELGKRDFTAFFLCRQVPRRSRHRHSAKCQPAFGSPPNALLYPLPGGRKQKPRFSKAIQGLTDL